MANFVYSRPGDNLIASITPTVPTGSVATESSVANLVDGNLAKALVFSSTTIRLVWDLGSSMAAHALYIGHHNFRGGTVKFEAHTSTDFTTPDVSTTISVPTMEVDGFFPGIFLDRSALANKRYVSLLVTSNTDAVKIGEIWLAGAKRTFLQNPNYGLRTPEDYRSVIHETAFDVQLAYSRGVRAGGLTDVSFLLARATDLVDLRNWYLAARGMARPFPFVLDPATGTCEFYRFDDRFSPDIFSPGLARIDMPFRRVSRGLPWVSV